MNNRSDILQALRHLLLVRLELEDRGLTASDLPESCLLMDPAGLGLDSVEVLDLLVGTEKQFGLRIAAIDRAFIEANCRSLSTLADFVLKAGSPQADAA